MKETTKEEKLYHNTAILLKIYQGVLWNAKHKLSELNDECLDLGYQGTRDAINLLANEFDQTMALPKMEEIVFNMRMTDRLVHIIDSALIALREYPKHGERYFDIINKMYIVEYGYTEKEIIESLNVSRRMLYREKKKALVLLGTILWGFMLPKLIKSFGDYNQPLCSDDIKLAQNWHGNATDNDTYE